MAKTSKRKPKDARRALGIVDDGVATPVIHALIYRTSQVAEQLGISELRLQNLIRSGVVKAPALAPGSNLRRWTEEDLDEARDAYAKWLKGRG